MKRCWISFVVLSCAVTGMVPVRAGEVPVNQWSGSAGGVSDYLFRGLSQTDRQPAVQAGVEFDHASGWYLGGWGSNVSWLSDGSTAGAPVSGSV